MSREFDQPYRYESLPIGYCRLSSSAVIVAVNPFWCGMTGRSADESIGCRIHNFVTPEAGVRIAEEQKTAAEKSSTFEVAILRNKGLTRTVLCVMQRIGTAEEGVFSDCFFTETPPESDRDFLFRAGEERFRELVEFLPEVLFEVDLQGNFTYANRRVREAFGYEPSDDIGSPNYLSMIDPSDRSRAAENFQRVARGEKIGVTEYLGLRKDGTRFAIMLRSSVIMRDGKPAGIRGFIVDITDRKRYEISLREKEERLRAFIDQTKEGVVIIDEEGRLVEWNPTAARMSGKPRAEVLGRPSWDVFSTIFSRQSGTENRIFFENLIREILRTGEVINRGPSVYEHIIADGSKRFTSQSMFSIKTLRGFQIGMITHDLTDRMEAERTLRESEERFRRLYEDSRDATFLMQDGRIIDCNDATVRLLRAESKERVCNGRLGEFSAPYQVDGRAAIEAAGDMVDIALKEGVHRFEWICRRADGSTIHAEFTLTPIAIQEQTVLYVVARDMTARI